MKTVAYSTAAVRVLRRLPRPVAERIRAKLLQYAADPASLAANVKALKGRPGFLRLRIGDWRVIMTEDETALRAEIIAPRGSAYD